MSPSDQDLESLDRIAAEQDCTRYAAHIVALRVGLAVLRAEPEAFAALAVWARAQGKRPGGQPRRSNP